MKYQIINGDNRHALKQFPDNHFDSIVTDPPYGIDFLGKAWDANTGALETYQECLRVLKPGGHILAFSAAKTYHHLAITLEQAGFEIRDQIMWIYSSGFPKSQDVGRQLHKKQNGKPDKQRFDKSELEQVKTSTPPNGIARLTFNQSEPNKLQDTGLWRHKVSGKIYKALPDINGDRLAVSHEGEKYGTVYEEVIEVNNEWSGWGTALKPAHEPIALARKPLKQTVAKNCLEWGTGAINIDATRIDWEPGEQEKEQLWRERYMSKNVGGPTFQETDHHSLKKGGIVQDAPPGRFPSNVLGDIPDYQKYFYCPKVSRKERHIGFDAPPPEAQNSPEEMRNHPLWDPSIGTNSHRLMMKIREHNKQGNNHPTVKPVELMKYLIKLVTPKGGRVLDPFNGSGSTGMAAVELGMEYVGIELDPAYVEIATRRIEAWNQTDTTFQELFE